MADNSLDDVALGTDKLVQCLPTLALPIFAEMCLIKAGRDERPAWWFGGPKEDTVRCSTITPVGVVLTLQDQRLVLASFHGRWSTACVVRL